jgi:hypothetical protein
LAAAAGLGTVTAGTSAAAADPVTLDDVSHSAAGGTDEDGDSFDLPLNGQSGEVSISDPLPQDGDKSATIDTNVIETDAASIESLDDLDYSATESSLPDDLPSPQASEVSDVTVTVLDGPVTAATAASEAAQGHGEKALVLGEQEASDQSAENQAQSDNAHHTDIIDTADADLAERLAALEALDSNGDGLLDGNDINFDQLAIWQDANHDGIADLSELSSLADHGISGISLGGASIDDYLDAQSLLTGTPASGIPLVTVQGSDAQLGKLASLDIGELLVGGDGYLDLDQALHGVTDDTPESGNSASAGEPSPSESQPAASSSEAAESEAPAPANDTAGTTQPSGGEQAEAQANEGPAETNAGPNHAGADSITVQVDDGAEQAANHAVA